MPASRVAACAALLISLLHPAAVPTHGQWGDQGDGTYANPVLPGDFSDLDAIRVGTRFYAISSTFQYAPGMVILASDDLVNWTIAGHVVADLTRISPQMNWNRMNREGRGIWAGSLRYHAGRYWVYFGTPDEGLWMSTALHAEGPWSSVEHVLAADGWDDPCPFWDDDGQSYLVATHYKPDPDGRTYTIHLWKLTVDGRRLVRGSDAVIHRSEGSEANKLYKINGLYYHYFSEVRAEGRVPMMSRARSLAGPWETRQLMHVNPSVDKEPNQGGMVELASGKWYFLTHQGTGDWEGRAGVLLPVTWRDGWPMLGSAASHERTPGWDGIGGMVWRGAKPIHGFPRSTFTVSDRFDKPSLATAWEWRYQPRPGAWSLTERPGSLRLRAFGTLNEGGFPSAGDVLTQRAARTARSEVTVKLDLTGMRDGQLAGLAHYAATYATLGVLENGAERRLTLTVDNRSPAGSQAGSQGSPRTEFQAQSQAGPLIQQPIVYLRSTWDFSGSSQFSYSLDGVHYTDFGEPYQLNWGHYRGDRVGLFTYSQRHPGGYVDIEDFAYKVAPQQDSAPR